MKAQYLTILLIFLCTCIALSQDPQRFEQEVQKFSEIEFADNEELVVFTGSSSVRLWENLEEDCHSAKVINTGFGGSQMSDLLYYIEKAVLRFEPIKVYIYEGDNDIFANKTPKNIIQTTKKVVEKIRTYNSKTEIYLISAKPSPSRWHFKKGYEELNVLFEAYSETEKGVFYINIWDPMLDEKGNPKSNIFVTDNLHMNREGYLIWRDVICGEIEK